MSDETTNDEAFEIPIEQVSEEPQVTLPAEESAPLGGAPVDGSVEPSSGDAADEERVDDIIEEMTVEDAVAEAPIEGVHYGDFRRGK